MQRVGSPKSLAVRMVESMWRASPLLTQDVFADGLCSGQLQIPRWYVTQTYGTEDVQSLLCAIVHSKILLDRFVDDLFAGLAAFADGLHLQLHLRLVSCEHARKRWAVDPTSLRKNGFVKLVSKPMFS